MDGLDLTSFLDLRSVREEQLRDWPMDNLLELAVEMGRQCNVRCHMCCQTDFRPGSKQAEIVWKERLLPGYQTAKLLTISGGEPTILPGARELLQMLLKDFSHLKFNAITNGLLFRGIWTEAFVKQGNIVNFSLNAIDPELYKHVVQFGRQKDVMANIDRLVRERNAANSKLIIRTSTVLLDETLHEMADFIQWAADHGLDQVVLNRNQLAIIKRYSCEEVRGFVAKAYQACDRNPNLRVLHLNDFDWFFARQHSLEPLRPRDAFQSKPKPCFTAFTTLQINPFGMAFPCCATWYPFGDLVKQPLADVWNSKAAYLFRSRMLKMDFRDCRLDCEFNYHPISYRTSQMRKIYWSYRRDPKVATQKSLRVLGLTSPQLKLTKEKQKSLEDV